MLGCDGLLMLKVLMVPGLNGSDNFVVVHVVYWFDFDGFRVCHYFKVLYNFAVLVSLCGSHCLALPVAMGLIFPVISWFPLFFLLFLILFVDFQGFDCVFIGVAGICLFQG